MEREYFYKNLSLETLPGEEWDSAPGFDGYYEISSLGRVKSVFRMIVYIDGRIRYVRERILKQSINNKRTKEKSVPGYLGVLFSIEGKTYAREVHRLMGLAFLPKSDKPCCVHIDHDTLYNVVTNLKWATEEEKAQQAWDIGNQHSTNLGKFGGDSSSAKSIKMLDMNGEMLRIFTSRTEAADWLIKEGFAPEQNKANISSAIRRQAEGRTKFSYGHKWSN